MTEPEAKKDDVAEAQFDRKQLIKMLVEFGPLIALFVANSQLGIYWATGIFMAATIVSLAVSRVVLGRIPMMPLVTALFVMVFGGLTIWLQDEHFIKVKPTIVYCLFAAILFGGLLAGKTFLKLALGEAFRLTDEGWRKLTVRWGGFFLFLALLNEFVWRNFSTDFWVGFKVFGAIPLLMLFAVAQVGLLQRYEQSGE
jgi:intracellular septation protein